MKLILQLLAPVVFVAAVVALGAQAPQTPPAGPGPTGAAAQAGGGRGGGIGAVAAALFVDKCAGCHGTDLSGGRAASLFDQKVLARLDDGRLARIIRAGLPAAGMPAFDDLTEEQVGQLIHHIRAETGNLAPKPAFIANPAGHILKTEKQTVKAELVADGLETPWGLAFLPDGRLLVTERSGTLRIIDKGTLSEPVKGTPKVHVQQDGGMLDVEVRRLQVADNKITAEEIVFRQFGRVRDIIQGPDGYLYIALQNPTGAGTGLSLSASTPGRVIRLVPGNN